MGWNTVEKPIAEPLVGANTCEEFVAPTFVYQPDPANRAEMIKRADRALRSTTSRCLFSRRLGRSVRTAIARLRLNEAFVFPTEGEDPRDPFLPPGKTWLPARKRGYDVPAQSISSGVEALYQQPFVAECAAAKQIAQVASLYENFGTELNNLLHPREIGVGLWQRYLESPAIRARVPLLIGRAHRQSALRNLASLGRYAFNGQMGYIRPDRGRNFIDSADNLGQNFIITEVNNNAVFALRNRARPLQELNAITRDLWSKYAALLERGLPVKALRKQMHAELLEADPFFSDIKVYVHPLGIKNFAYHIARQFRFNPRTSYSFEMYEDYLYGFAYRRYIQHNLNGCKEITYCRSIEKKRHLLIGPSGRALGASYSSRKACLRAAARQTR